MSKISVAVLGATGMIGQRFIQMLEDHPYFEIEGLYASERSEGKRLSEVLKVRDHVYLDETMDRKIEVMDIKKISKNCRVAFSGIPSDLAGPTETELAESGVAVFTNAGSHRMDEHVPIRSQRSIPIRSRRSRTSPPSPTEDTSSPMRTVPPQGSPLPSPP